MDKLFKPGQRVFVAGSSNEPTQLLSELAKVTLPPDLEFIQFPLAGYNSTDFTGLNETATQTTFFMTPSLKEADKARLNFLPMQMRAVFEYLRRGVDVVLVQVAHDKEGKLRLGPNVDFIEAAMESASVVIAELNMSFVAPAGSKEITSDQIDHVIQSDRPLYEMSLPQKDEVAEEIGRLVSGLVKDGACIQTGIGAIPAAILNQLSDKNDLGMHGGLIDDGGMRLIKEGNLTGQKKRIDRGKHVVGMALGTQDLYDWLANEVNVDFQPANYTHEVQIIRQLDNFISVNSALEVDLFGQVNAEFTGGRQLSGTGGSVDFMRAAKASEGGKSIVAMNSTARGGTISRIVSKVEMVTALRTDVDIVVTEWGVAELKALPNRQRAEALIKISAPQFREQLKQSIE